MKASLQTAALVVLCSIAAQTTASANCDLSFRDAVEYVKRDGNIVDICEANMLSDNVSGTMVEKSPCSVRIVSSILGIGSPTLMDADNGLISEILSYFRENTENFVESIDVSRFNIKVSDEVPNEDTDLDQFYLQLDEEAKKIYELLVFSSPRSYYLMKSNGTYGYTFFDYESREGDGTYLTAICPIYYVDIYDDFGFIDPEKVEAIMPEVESNRALIDSETDIIRSYISDDMSDIEKLTALHYALTLRYTYSFEDMHKPIDERHNNTALELLKNKKGLCTAFSTLFNYLAMELGLPDAGFVTSHDSYGNDYHVWNLVKVATDANDGVPSWYHVDISWDNSQNDGYGCTCMEYFLLDTDTMNSTHNLYENGEQVVFAPSEEEIYETIGEHTSGTYNDALWHHSATMVVPYAHKWYFILHQSGADRPSVLYEFDPNDPDHHYNELYRFGDLWTSNGVIYDHSYTGLGIVNGSLYFNGPKNVYSYDVATGEVAEEEGPELDEDESIFSSYICGDTLYYGVNSSEGSRSSEPDIILGGTYQVADVAVSEAKIHDGHLTFKVDTYASDNEPKTIAVSVRSGDTITTEVRSINSFLPMPDSAELAEASDSGEFDIPLADESTIPVIYVWDEHMRPYITNFCIDSTIYTHSGNGGAETVN